MRPDNHNNRQPKSLQTLPPPTTLLSCLVIRRGKVVALVPLIDICSPSTGYPLDLGTLFAATNQLSDHDTDSETSENL